MRYMVGYHSSEIESPHVALVTDEGEADDLFDVRLYTLNDGDEKDEAYIESKNALDLMVARANSTLGLTDAIARIQKMRDEAEREKLAYVVTDTLTDSLRGDEVGSWTEARAKAEAIVAEYDDAKLQAEFDNVYDEWSETAKGEEFDVLTEADAELETLGRVLDVLQALALGKEPEQGKLTEKETVEFYGRSLYDKLDAKLKGERRDDDEFGSALESAFDNIDHLIGHLYAEGADAEEEA